MDRLALLLAAVALGAVAWTQFDHASPATTEVDATGVQALRAEVSALTDEVHALREQVQHGPLTGTHAPVPSRGATGPGLVGQGDDRPSMEAVRADQASVAERLEALETWKREAQEEGNGFGGPAMLHRLGNNRMITDVDTAQQRLDLSASQRADMESILADAQQEIDVLMDTPNEEGTTLRSLAGGMSIQLGDDGAIDPSKIMGSIGRVMAFKQGAVPGRNETYAAAESRIRGAATRRIRENLNDEQRRTWDRSHSDPLIPRAGSGGMVSVAFGAIDVDTSSDDVR